LTNHEIRGIIVIAIFRKEGYGMKTLGQQIKEVRQKAGLTQVELANLYGIPRRTVEDWERGAHEPPEYVANLLIDRIKSDFLYDQSEQMVLSAPKKKVYTDFMGKPLPPDIEASVRKAFGDRKVQFVGAIDEEGNEIEDPRKGKPYMVLTPEEYGLDLGLTFYAKEV
jgi:transcriptional regulator with XRE-family HTH domain